MSISLPKVELDLSRLSEGRDYFRRGDDIILKHDGAMKLLQDNGIKLDIDTKVSETEFDTDIYTIVRAYIHTADGKRFYLADSEAYTSFMELKTFLGIDVDKNNLDELRDNNEREAIVNVANKIYKFYIAKK